VWQHILGVVDNDIVVCACGFSTTPLYILILLYSLVRYVILGISVAKIDFIVFLA